MRFIAVLFAFVIAAAPLAWAAPMTTQPVQTMFGNVTLTYDPDDPSSTTANVAGAKDAQGNVVGTSVQMNAVHTLASGGPPPGTAVAYCAAATSFTYCDANGNTLMHYGPWYFFRNITMSSQSGNWITQHNPPSGHGPPSPPRPDGPNQPGGGGGQWVSPAQITIGIGDRGFIDSPGINLPCPPLPGANPMDQTLTQKFTTVLYTGIPPRAWAMFKWGHTITYNEATKATSIQSCPVTGHLAGQQSFNDCLNALNAHAQQAGYDPIVPVSGYYYVYLGPAEIELPNSVMGFTIQVNLSMSPAQRRELIHDPVAFLAQIRRGAAGR